MTIPSSKITALCCAIHYLLLSFVLNSFTVRMPHAFLHRRRLMATLWAHREELVVTHFVWESINAACYLVGGITFIAGSVFFLPGQNEAIGS